jgi:two-component system competent response regulator ComA
MAKILVVDLNEAFAAMLKDMLEREGGYQVTVTGRGSDALALAAEDAFDLTIVDMDLDPADMGYRELILGLRQTQPTMRLVLIPLMGEELPPEAHRLDIQGALSKPFFADDLLPGIREALSKEVHIVPSRDQTAGPAGQPESNAASQIEEVLAELIRETQAVAVWLVSSDGGTDTVVAQGGNMSRRSAQTLTYLSMNAVRSAQAVARFLGQADEPFEHNMFESTTSRLYIMTLPGNLALLIVTPIHTPLGTIRHNLRRAWRHLDHVALT